MREIQILDFDTRLLGFKVGRYTETKLSCEKAKDLIEYCKREEIKCVYADLDINDFESINTATRHGFVIVDVRITFEIDLLNWGIVDKVEIDGYRIDDIVTEKDIRYLLSISREISRVSRFEFDRNFPMGSAERLYRGWMLNSINKIEADDLFIARDSKSRLPVGVVTGKREKDYARVVLLGVETDQRKKGIGKSLLIHILSFYKSCGYKKVRAITQGRNLITQRLNEKVGFLIYSISLYLHLWIK